MSEPVSGLGGPSRGALHGPMMPPGEEVASFASYAEAQHAVDSLSDEGFPVQFLSIVGTDLRQVERITGRMSWGRAVVSGALSGLWLGLFFGVLLAIMGPGEGGAFLLLAAVALGVLWGALFQVVAYAMTRGRRDFTSTSAVVASRYAIVASEHARDAARALAPLPGNLSRGGEVARRAEERRAARHAARGEGPTPFGSRPDEEPRFGVRINQGGSGNAGNEPAGSGAPQSADQPAGQDAGQGSGSPQDPQA